MANEILGKGWKFPIIMDATKSISESDFEDNIRESIKIILGTAKGERVMRPDFGCGIHNHVFGVINTTTTSLIKTSVEESLRTFEPRIEVTMVTVDVKELNSGKLNINIEYRVIRTNNQFNLVYPFYLTEGS